MSNLVGNHRGDRANVGEGGAHCTQSQVHTGLSLIFEVGGDVQKVARESSCCHILGFHLTSQVYRITLAAMLVYSLLISICQITRRYGVF